MQALKTRPKHKDQQDTQGQVQQAKTKYSISISWVAAQFLELHAPFSHKNPSREATEMNI